MEIMISQGQKINRYKLAGGGSNSEYWSQMFADVFNKPVEIIQEGELGAFGLCLCVGIGTGLFENFDDAWAHMSNESKIYIPDPKANEIYERRYKKWTELVAHMCSYWDKQEL